MSRACAVLYSGGTDSTCAVALLAQDFSEIHLITFFERGTKASPIPSENIQRIREKFPKVAFRHCLIDADELVKHFAYENYFRNLWRHGLFLLAMPGFSTLSWHTLAIAYCRERGIDYVADGLTRELMHFPGHMERIIPIFRKLYEHFGIEYRNPVRDWPVPPDLQFMEKLLVNYHLSEMAGPSGTTTGKYLFDLGLMPAPNIKGSKLDQAMQHDCYPFVMYNMFVFWFYLPTLGWNRFERGMEKLFNNKVSEAERELVRHFARDPLSMVSRCVSS